MAIRSYYYVENGFVKRNDVEFEWHAGFAVCQKRKRINSLHKQMNVKVLEISTKSEEDLEARLSAFRLQYRGYLVENLYQAGKFFENGGLYKELLSCSAKDAKRYEKLKTFGKLISYKDRISDKILTGHEPFYDYLYISAVPENLSTEELKELISYEGFTDIEFNPLKGVNTQAKAVAIVKLLIEKYGEIPDAFSKEEFIQFHKTFVQA